VAAGEIWVGADAVAGGGARFGAGGLFAAAGTVAGAAGVGRGAGAGVLAAGVVVAARCAADAAVPVPGSAVMMLTAGVEDALGNSALVGRPVGMEVPSIATGLTGGGAFQDGA
jgi:hypothetical protein